MIHKAGRSIGEVPYGFEGHQPNFKVTWDKKLRISTRIERFRTVTPVWIHPWVWNDAQSWKEHRRGALWFWRSSAKFQGHMGQKIADFDPNWAFPDSNSSLNSPMGLKWCTKLNVVLFIDVIHQIWRLRGTKKSQILTRIERLWTVTQVWLNRLIWNDARSLMLYRRSALLQCYPSNFKVTRETILTQIERFRTVTPVWIHRWIWND